MVGKTRKRDANDDSPEQNRRSLKLVVKAFFIRVMLELLRSISRPSMVKHELFRSISITKIGIGEISMDRAYTYIFLSTPIVSFRIGIEYLSINRCDCKLKRIPQRRRKLKIESKIPMMDIDFPKIVVKRKNGIQNNYACYLYREYLLHLCKILMQNVK